MLAATGRRLALKIAMKLIIAILYAILAMAFSGCLPNAVTYYRPSVEGGQLRQPRCVPTKSLVDFTIGNSRKYLLIRALSDNGKHVHQVALFFSDGSLEKFHFASTDFRIFDLDKKIMLRPSSVVAYLKSGQGALTTEPYYLKAGKGPVLLSVQINVPGMLPANFKLLSPSIVIDGEEIALPVIHFERKVWVGISPFNC